MDKTASDILLAAAILLEEEGKWSKGSYVKYTEHGCTMCAHGAIAYCGRLDIKDIVEAHQIYPESEINRTYASRTYNEEYALYAEEQGITIEQYVLNKYGPTGLAHYKATEIGLTFQYNDNHNTTKQDVINKLRLAAHTTSSICI